MQENTGAGLSPAASTPNAQPADQQAEAEAQPLRILFGLQTGRVVSYVLTNGAIRPLLVLDPGDKSGRAINGVLFFLPSDAKDLPFFLANDNSGHKPLCSAPIGGIPFDDEGKSGTWHWPEVHPSAMASSVDPAALQVQVQVIAEAFLGDIRQDVADQLANQLKLQNEKLEAQTQGISDLLQKQTEFLQDELAKLGVKGQLPTATLAGTAVGDDGDAIAGCVGGAGNAPAGESQAATSGEPAVEPSSAPTGDDQPASSGS